jgi:hypothetical protein
MLVTGGPAEAHWVVVVGPLYGGWTAAVYAATDGQMVPLPWRRWPRRVDTGEQSRRMPARYGARAPLGMPGALETDTNLVD